jgi:hypothetical protein
MDTINLGNYNQAFGCAKSKLLILENNLNNLGLKIAASMD